VVGTRRVLVILLMAREAGRRREIEVSVGVALIALQLRVSARQREANRIMIEAGRRPGRGRVAELAGLRQPQREMVRVARLLVIGEMAAHAGGGRAFVFPAYVASRAVERRVHAGQRKIRWRPSMVELRSQPGVDVMALLALRGEA
jgi:hypothetical protein